MAWATDIYQKVLALIKLYRFKPQKWGKKESLFTPFFYAMTKSTTTCSTFILLGLLVFICYSNTFTVPWILDDPPNITQNPLSV